MWGKIDPIILWCWEELLKPVSWETGNASLTT